jgi:precorrin-6B C5,15-methyltransferase / cobalt-precorrin-6B C5,C15-methyltransferase
LGARAGESLWDIGAGAGSIGIEWMLSHPDCRAVAVEAEPARCERIGRNARALGVPALQIVQARAPDGLETLPQPDAVFIGGGASEPGVFERCWSALPRGGRLVINAVALETEARLLDWHARYGGELKRISIENSVPLGTLRGWRAVMPVTQWRVDKP